MNTQLRIKPIDSTLPPNWCPVRNRPCVVDPHYTCNGRILPRLCGVLAEAEEQAASNPRRLALELEGLRAESAGRTMSFPSEKPQSGRWPDHRGRGRFAPGDEKVTVIIPTRSRPHLIGRALAGVQSQSFQRWSCIVVLNGPACESRDYQATLEPFTSDPRIAFLSAPDASGIAGSINPGLALATSEYACVLDDDDTWREGFLETLVGVLVADPTLGLAYSDCDHPVEDGSARVKSHAPHPPAGGTFLAAQSKRNWFGWSQAVWRRELLVGVGPANGKPLLAPEAKGCADRDAWLRISRVSGVYHVPEELASHSWHGSNASEDANFMGPGHEWVEGQIRAGKYRSREDKWTVPLGVPHCVPCVQRKQAESEASPPR